MILKKAINFSISACKTEFMVNKTLQALSFSNFNQFSQKIFTKKNKAKFDVYTNEWFRVARAN